MTTPRLIIGITGALPYANGPLHLGHLLEHIQTNIWVNTQKNARTHLYQHLWRRCTWHTYYVKSRAARHHPRGIN